jgi:retron-type reverse transcriptase
MTTGLERIAAKAREDRKLKFTSLAHHVTPELLWESVSHIPKRSAPGCDGQTVEEAQQSFKQWAPEFIRAIHEQGYRPPPIRRVFIPKPGKSEKRPLGVPCVTDRAMQRSVAAVLSAIYEQEFLSCSFGGRPKRSAHQALATLGEILSGVPAISYVLEADLKNYLERASHYPRVVDCASKRSGRAAGTCILMPFARPRLT